jgi:hypothetical protein
MQWQFLGTIVAPIVQAITSLSGVVGLFLVWQQIRISNVWNRANTQHALLSNLPSLELEERLWKIVESLPQENRRLLPTACTIIYEDVSHWVTIKTFLNKHEQLCAAINTGTIDDRYAYDVHGVKIVDAFLIFEAYIEFIRAKSSDATIYLELEKVATHWSATASMEKEAVKAEQAQMKTRRGAKRIV